MKRIPALRVYQKLHRLEPNKKKPSPLKTINPRIFLIPAVLMIIGGIIWVVIAIDFPANVPLILLGQIIFMIGMFVAIILGFWVITIIRLPQR